MIIIVQSHQGVIMTDGRFAFPSTVQSGMTLRDYYAGIALKIMLDVNKYSDTTSTCQTAWRIADEMMKEREASKTRSGRYI